MAKPSEYVCQACGVPVSWSNGGWKHHASKRWMGRSCGQTPHVVTRDQYERASPETS